MRNTSAMTMNTKSAFAPATAGFACAQMPCASEAEYVMLFVGAIAMVSTFVLPIIHVVAVVPLVLLALRLRVVLKTK